MSKDVKKGQTLIGPVPGRNPRPFGNEKGVQVSPTGSRLSVGICATGVRLGLCIECLDQVCQDSRGLGNDGRVVSRA